MKLQRPCKARSWKHRANTVLAASSGQDQPPDPLHHLHFMEVYQQTSGTLSSFSASCFLRVRIPSSFERFAANDMWLSPVYAKYGNEPRDTEARRKMRVGRIIT